MSGPGGGFRIDPDALNRAAEKLHGHANEIEGHGRTLGAKTGGRVGHGPIGQVAEGLVKRGLHAVSEGVSMAVADFHRGTANGLKAAATRISETDAKAARGFHDLERAGRHDVPRLGSAPTRVPSLPPQKPFAPGQSIRNGPLDKLHRPTGVEASLTKQHIGTGTPASQGIKPPGFEGMPSGHARGHLLGAQLGGSGKDPKNLITIYQKPANSPVMLSYERQVRVALESGQQVEYSATPIYSGDQLVARGITLKATGSGDLNFWVTVLNRGR